MNRHRMLPSYRFYDVEGTSLLTLDRSVGKPLRDCKIYGNSVQDGTPSPENPVEVQSCGDKSKNLINWDLMLADKTVTKVENGYKSSQYFHGYYLADTNNAMIKAFLNQLIAVLKPNTSYTLSRVWKGGHASGTFGNIQITSKDGILVSSGYGEGLRSVTFSLTQEEINSISGVRVYYAGSGSGEYSIIEPQLTESEGVLPYEPYGYKIPIEVGGKNLFDIDAFLALPNASKYYKKDADNNLVQIIQDYRQYTNVPVYMELPPGTYTVSLTGATKDLWLVCVNDVVVTDTFTLTETSPVKIKSFYQAGTVVGKFQLERGDTATEYEAYRKEVTNIYLDEPLYKIGNYADYIDKINSKVVRNIFEYTFVGNEFSGTPFADLGTTICLYTRSLVDGRIVEATMGFSEKGIFDGKVISLNDNERCMFTNVAGTNRTGFYARILKSRCADPDNPTADDFNKIYTAGTKVYGVRENPTEQPIDLPPILTHKGTNIISVGTEIPPSNMQIQYYK